MKKSPYPILLVILLLAGCQHTVSAPAVTPPLAKIWATPSQPLTPAAAANSPTPFPRLSPAVTATLPGGRVTATASPATTVSPIPAAAQSEPTPTATPAAQARVVSAGLNVRSGPGINYPVVATLAQGEVVLVINADPNSGWLQVELPYPQKTGWLSGQPTYVSLDGAGAPVEQATLSSTRPGSPGTATPAPNAAGAAFSTSAGAAGPVVEVYAAEVDVLNQPGGGAITSLKRGALAPVQALDETAGYARISLPGGNTGWVSLTGDEVRLASGLNRPGTSQPNFDRPAPAQGLTGTLVLQTTSGGDIYAIDAAGAHLRRITSGLDPQLSPDGSQIAFTRWEPEYELFTINLDGSSERSWLKKHQIKSPTWSADGSRLVFSFQLGGRLQDERRRIDLLEAAMNGDGIHIPANARDVEIENGILKFTIPMDAHWYLGQIDLATGEYTDLNLDRYSYGPTWHPTGPNLLIYKSEQTLSLYDARTRTTQPIGHDFRDHTPIISPDGRRIAVSYRQQDHWEVHVLNIDGSGRRRLTETPTKFIVAENRSWNNAAPTWSPDGSKLAFVTDRAGRWEIWVMNADGSDQRPMFPAEINNRLQLSYNGVDERMLSWH